MTKEQMAALEPGLRKYLAAFRECFLKEVTFGYLGIYTLGLMSDCPRKSVEPIALAAEVPVRTLQEFLSSFRWDHPRAEALMRRQVADRPGPPGIGIIDASGHAKQGDKTPGVKRQWCGETGKIDNCVVGQHLLYTDNDPANPFGCIICSDLFLPEEWANDRQRCREAGIPEELAYRPKWQIAIDQVRLAIGDGVRFSYLIFDEDYGSMPGFWRQLDALGQVGIGEVRANFDCWTTPPACHSSRAEHAPREVQNLHRHSPVFYGQDWQEVIVKNTTRGKKRWRSKAARVQITDTSQGHNVPSDRRYWLIVAESPETGEIKYFLSNAPASTSVLSLLKVAFSRWHIEKWFERAKQETGFGAFEVRTYDGLIRHWLCSRMAMYFLASSTQELREKKSADHIGAGGPGGQHPGREDLADLAEILGSDPKEERVLSVA
jgi:SRSO17 transposase